MANVVDFLQKEYNIEHPIYMDKNIIENPNWADYINKYLNDQDDEDTMFTNMINDSDSFITMLNKLDDDDKARILCMIFVILLQQNKSNITEFFNKIVSKIDKKYIISAVFNVFQCQTNKRTHDVHSFYNIRMFNYMTIIRINNIHFDDELDMDTINPGYVDFLVYLCDTTETQLIKNHIYNHICQILN